MTVVLPECQLLEMAGDSLAEEAEAQLLSLAEHGLRVERVDIGGDERLMGRYRHRVPVLRRTDTGIELDWPFDAGQVMAFLGNPLRDDQRY